MNADTNMLDSRSTTAPGRIVELDALRALAAINLVLFHFTHVYQVKYGYVGSLGFSLPYGKYGVQLFFMLSGFVNAMTLLRKKNAGDFLVNRLLRIYPSFWVMIGLNLILVMVSPIALGSLTAETAAANATAMPNLFGQRTIEPVTWTIQVEMLFYGIILLMFFTGSLDKPLRTISLYVLLALVSCFSIDFIAARNPQAGILPSLNFARQLLILDYIPLFAMGMLLHEIYIGRGKRWLNIAGITFSGVVFHLIDAHGHNPIVTIAFIGLLTASAYGKLPFLRLKPFVFISSISYALYLMHNNLGSTLIYWVNHAGLSPLASLLLAITIVTLLATAYTFWFEQPMTRMFKAAWQSVKRYATGRRLQPPTVLDE